jgi:hypothetical protein
MPFVNPLAMFWPNFKFFCIIPFKKNKISCSSWTNQFYVFITPIIRYETLQNMGYYNQKMFHLIMFSTMNIYCFIEVHMNLDLQIIKSLMFYYLFYINLESWIFLHIMK